MALPRVQYVYNFFFFSMKNDARIDNVKKMIRGIIVDYVIMHKRYEKSKPNRLYEVEM